MSFNRRSGGSGYGGYGGGGGGGRFGGGGGGGFRNGSAGNVNPWQSNAGPGNPMSRHPQQGPPPAHLANMATNIIKLLQSTNAMVIITYLCMLLFYLGKNIIG